MLSCVCIHLLGNGEIKRCSINFLSWLSVLKEDIIMCSKLYVIYIYLKKSILNIAFQRIMLLI